MKPRIRNYMLAGLFVLAMLVSVAPSAVGQTAVREVNNPAYRPYVFSGGGNWIGNAPNISFFPTRTSRLSPGS